MEIIDWHETWGNVEEALLEKYSICIVIGPTLQSEEQKEYIINLMEKYPSYLDIFISPSKPERNSCKINNNIMFEDIDIHSEDGCSATVIENSDEYNQRLYEINFQKIKSLSKKAMIGDIRKMSIYPV